MWNDSELKELFAFCAKVAFLFIFLPIGNGCSGYGTSSHEPISCGNQECGFARQKMQVVNKPKGLTCDFQYYSCVP